MAAGVEWHAAFLLLSLLGTSAFYPGINAGSTGTPCLPIATCSDDNTVRIWRLNRGAEQEQALAGQKDFVGWACQKKPEIWPLLEKNRTPDKTQRRDSNSIVSSPLQAACAPNYAGDLPLPTSTPTSAIKMLSIKLRTPASQKAEDGAISPIPSSNSKMSLKNWVTRTPNSSKAPGAKTPSPRKDHAPLKMQTVSTSKPVPQTEKRAKRRLETSSQMHTEDCVQLCSCVTELDPAMKRIKLDLCSSELDVEPHSEEACLDLAQLSDSAENIGLCTMNSSPPGSPLPIVDCGSPSSPPFKLHGDLRTGFDGKENRSPEGKTWLCAMGEKLKIDKTCSLIVTPISRKQLLRSAASSLPSAPSTPASMRKICAYFHKKSPE